MTEEPNKSRTFAATCASCSTAAVFDVLKLATLPPDEESPWAVDYYFSRCKNCGGLALYAQEIQDDSLQLPRDRVYPAQKRQINFSLPKLVRESYREAVRCESGQVWLACAVMVGRTLEAVSKEFAPHAKSLSSALQEMFKDGTISQDIFDWASQLRITRNVAAHAQETGISREDAIEGMDFAQAILEILYDLRPRFERMKKRHRTQKT